MIYALKVGTINHFVVDSSFFAVLFFGIFLITNKYILNIILIIHVYNKN